MNNRLFLMALAIIVLLLPGCWSNTEMEERAVIAAIGVDKGENGGYEVTVQAVVASETAGGAAGTTRGGGGGGNKKPFMIIKAEGATIADAMSMLEIKCSRVLFLPFIDIFVVGREMAEEGIEPLADWVARDRNLRLRMLLGVSETTAADIIESPGAGLEKIPGFFIASVVNTSQEENSRVAYLDFTQYLDSINLDYKEPLALRLTTTEVDGQKQALVSGSAVFKDYRLIGWLNEAETRGYMWASGQVSFGVIPVSLPEGGHISFTIRGSSTKIETKFVNGEPVINIKVNFKSNINEVGNPNLMLNEPKEIERLQLLLAESVSREINAAIDKAKELNADFLGLGQALYRQNPRELRRYRVVWEEIFQSVPVSVEVNATVRRTDQLGNPVRTGGD